MTDRRGPKLEVHLFGRFELIRDGEPLDPTSLGRRKNQSLLKLLLSERGRVFTKDELVDQLFADLDPDKAIANLYSRISKLRSVLEPGLSRGNESRFILRSGDGYCFNPDADCWIDIEVFQETLDRAREFHRAEDFEKAQKLYEDAHSLYRGDFLSEDRYEEWTLAPREHWRGQYLTAFEAQAECCGQLGRYDQAIDLCRALLSEEPYNEAAFRRLMTVHAQSGERDTALAVFDECVDALQAHLGADPSDGTQALHEQIRRGELSPPPRTTPHNLPHEPTPLLGRDDELQHLDELLQDPTCRLVSLVGPGGIGKTKLGIEAARGQLDRFPDGVFVVTLASLANPGDLVYACADAIGAELHGPKSPEDQLIHVLKDKTSLLVLDNFEHLLDAAPFVARLLRETPSVKVLVTSRQRLHLQAEWHVPVAGLPVVKTDDRAPQESALVLFEQAAQQAHSSFEMRNGNVEAVARICERVEGMPLAIELAAVWTQLLPVEEIAHRIDQSLDLLQTVTRDVPDRHRSMRAVFEHSWSLLSEDERATFKRLSVFQGSFNTDAAEAIAGATLPLLAALMDKSLIRRHAEGRYDLHELMRQYGAEKLEATPEIAQQTRQAHAVCYLQWLAEIRPALMGSGQMDALARVRDEIDNVRTAWDWAARHRRAKLLRDANLALAFVYELRSWFREGANVFAHTVEQLDQVIINGDDDQDDVTAALGGALTYEGWFRFSLGEPQRAQEVLERGLHLLQRVDAPVDEALARAWLGSVAYVRGDYDRARTRYEESIPMFREHDEAFLLANALNWLGEIVLAQGEHDRSRELHNEAMAIYEEIENQWGICRSFINLSEVDYRDGDDDQAQALAEQGLEWAEQIDVPFWIIWASKNLGKAFHQQGDAERAEQLLTYALELAQEIGEQRFVAIVRAHLGEVATARGDLNAATEHFRQALTISTNLAIVPVLLDAMIGMIEMLTSSEQSTWAAKLAALVVEQPAAEWHTRQQAQRAWDHLETRMGTSALREARKLGATAQPEDVARDLLDGPLSPNDPRTNDAS